ncbi:MAG: FAD-dependent oxidoreductase, partial [Burkholderiales bacterium]
MSTLEIKVPDIGDFKSVDVIEVLVKVGDGVTPEQSLITVESDKATMEIPSPTAGVIKELRVKVGDKVAEGTLIVMLETSAAAASAPASTPAPAPAVAPTKNASGPAPAATAVATGPASSYTGQVDITCDMLVLGAGPGGYSAAFRSADLGMNVVLVERYPVLGGVCLNVGCIPSKALLHVASVTEEAQHLAEHGVTFGAPQFDLDKLRAWKSKVVGKLTAGLAGMAKARKVNVVQGVGTFVSPNHMAVETASGRKVVQFKTAIIAAGSQASKLPFLTGDARIVDSTDALELPSQPKRMLVIGGGIIGLEMGTVYSTLGARLDVVEMLDGLMAGPDRDLVNVWQKWNAHRFGRVMLKTKTAKVEAKPDGLYVKFEGENAPGETQR